MSTVATSELLHRVEEAITKIRPYLEQDGGNITLLEVTDEMVARVELQGACKDCSMRQMTFKAGITETILREVPEIKAVEEVEAQP